MPKRRHISNLSIALLVTLMIFVLSAPVMAQKEEDAGTAQPPKHLSDRLFLAFAEDAVIADSQWWEGQGAILDNDPADATLARLVFALKPFKRIEVGGRVGFGSTDAPPSFQDGSGATDLELWAKYDLGSTGDSTHLVVGATAIVPTGDDSAGLGFDSFGAGIFGAFRQQLSKALLSGHIGMRINQDGRYMGVDLDGKTSAMLGMGVFVPLTDEITLVGEARAESKRFEGGETDCQILGGIDWHLTNRGVFRGALAFGLTDGAPDTQILAGYAVRF